jgi:hypothetical protein
MYFKLSLLMAGSIIVKHCYNIVEMQLNIELSLVTVLGVFITESRLNANIINIANI